jgi:hypothetical protein
LIKVHHPHHHHPRFNPRHLPNLPKKQVASANPEPNGVAGQAFGFKRTSLWL